MPVSATSSMTINDPPPVLYVRGELHPADDSAIAIVGTRRASVYGREAARVLAWDLARAEIAIISGLAHMGSEHQAHRAAIDAGGRTIAVLGSGVDACLPQKAATGPGRCKHGALLSEYALGTAPEGRQFSSPEPHH